MSWQAPYFNGEAIIAYHIEFMTASSLWQPDPTCDGSTQSVLNQQSCVIPMDNLALSFGLVFDQLIKVRVSASNARG